MTKIKPKLYLNMSPQTQEEGSLAFARNMKVDDDGNLISDYGYKNITCTVSNDATPAVALNTYNIIGHIVGLDNKIYFLCATVSGTTWTDSKIIEYDEIANNAKKLSTNWTYSGGKISGCVNTNQSGEKILTIGEYDVPNQKKVPLKHINLSYSTVADESFYTQAPVVPITNLILTGTYVKTIPNGVYVFFIRYKIRKDVYTPWYICSSPIFAGTREKISTLQGGLSYINTHKDSAKSFIFAVNYIVPSNLRFYSEFQLGFIITHDEATDARIWKSFPTTILINNEESNNTSSIYFDYEDIQEANIDDMLATTYEIFNVKNVTSFKNKLYIGNYEETDFSINDDLSDLANNIKLCYDRVENSGSISYKKITINGNELNFNYSTGRYVIPSGSNFNNIVGSLSNCFNITISKLAKIETREKQDILKFDIGWKANDNPDLCFVYNIYNYVYNNELFGPSWEVNYNNARSCIREIYHSGSGDNILWLYGNNPGSQHPFYNKNLTFAYSSLPDNYSDVSSNHKRNKVFFFRANTKIYTISGYSGDEGGWLAKDRGFDNFARSAIDDNIVKEITNKNKIAIAYIELTYGAKVYKINSAIQRHSDYENFLERIDKDNYCGFSNDYVNEISFISTDYFTTGEPSQALKDTISTYVSDVLNSYTQGFTEDCIPIVNLGGITGSWDDVFPVNSVNVIFKKWDFTVDSEDLEVDTDNYFKRFKVSLKITDYASVCSFSIKDNKYTFNTYDNLSTQASSLMPISKYKAYAHFVDNRNIITDGIEIPILENISGTAEATITPPKHKFNDLIKLKFKYIRPVNDNNPLYDKYKAFFISIVNVGDLVAECFGYTKKGTTHIVNCLEADTLLYNITDNIFIYVSNRDNRTVLVTKKAKYYSSSSSTPTLAFGNCGYIAWDDNDIEEDEEITEIQTYLQINTIYIVISRDKTKENNYQLVKSSSYISLIGMPNALELPCGFYGSYYCSVKKPDFGLSSRCYVSGNDVYGINRDTSLELSEFKSYIQLQTSPTYFVTSNFNLNYLSLTEDITDKIFNIGSASSGIKEVAKVINSATLSYIYELKSMYKDFMNKKFKCSEDGYKTTFDNTVRVSNVLSDETFNNSVFKFGATDYYNIPTDRGIIESLFAIGNNIFAHTKGSLYKFDANQTIAASDTDITLKESEPFDIGISQVFDSQYGYGGIDNKEAGCITFDSYFFYDRFTNHIFAYSGNGQIQIIDGNIYKFLKHYNFVTCYTLHDDINHRVLFDLRTSLNKKICVSYNYKAKAFISVHDMLLDKSFYTRNKCYSYRQSLCELFNKGDITNVVLNNNLNLLKLYGGASGFCGIFFGTDPHAVPDSCFNIAVVLPVVENIREVINNIKYIGDVVKNYIKNKIVTNPEDEQDHDYYDLIFNDEHTLYQSNKAVNPVQSIYIITDSCVSNIVNDTLDETNRPNSLKDDPSIPAGLTDYKGIRHDIDGWNVNFFRNILHTNNVYDYPGETGANSPGQPRVNYRKTNNTIDTYHPNSDNHSLVYGKYFIIVFNFITDKPVKMEELFISTSKY